MRTAFVDGIPILQICLLSVLEGDFKVTRKRFQKLLRSRGIFKETAIKKIWCKNYADVWEHLGYCAFGLNYDGNNWREAKRLEMTYKKKEESFYMFCADCQIAGVIRGEIWFPIDGYTILTNWKYLEDKFTEEYYNLITK